VVIKRIEVFVIYLFLQSLSSTIFAQNIFQVRNAGQADVKVFEVNNSGSADLLVYKVNNPGEAKRNNGHWFFVKNSGLATKKIFFVKNQGLADLKIYYVKNSGLARWVNRRKMHLMR
tara:strand:+ start:559 stop:909 length:351 start_codon:yes stop_codon:yes gene_type:complete